MQSLTGAAIFGIDQEIAKPALDVRTQSAIAQCLNPRRRAAKMGVDIVDGKRAFESGAVQRLQAPLQAQCGGN